MKVHVVLLFWGSLLPEHLICLFVTNCVNNFSIWILPLKTLDINWDICVELFLFTIQVLSYFRSKSFYI
jgi:hypothetical protein